MKKNASTKTFLAIILIMFLPLFMACPPPITHETTTTTSAVLNPVIQGSAKQCPSTGLKDVRVKSNDGFETCSQSDGSYSLVLGSGGNKIVTYRKKDYQMHQEVVINIGPNDTLTKDVCLNNSTYGYEISGYVGKQQEGITVILYQLTCGGSYSEIARMKTCADGTYSFSGQRQTDGTIIDLPAGTYKVEPKCIGFCTFTCKNCTPTQPYIENIPIPNTQQYDFNAACGTGSCGPID